MCRNSQHRFRSAVLACVLLGIASLAVASDRAIDWPALSAPRFVQAQWVAEELENNGMPMRIQSVTAAMPVADTLAAFRELWARARGGEMVEQQLGEWEVLAQRDGDFYFSVQLKGRAGGGSEGFLAVSHLATVFDRGPQRATKFPMLSGTEVVSNTKSQDLGRLAQTILLMNGFSIDSNASFYQGRLRREGWGLGQDYVAERTQPKARVLYFERSGESCYLTFTKTDEGQTLIAINVLSEERY